ncbi:MAG: YggS family pyridoxal phosphate-dependent enzyme [Thermostichales cyanobacterium SZTDM-1c_bins_54]
MDPQTLAANLQRIQQGIPAGVEIMAVSKGVAPEVMRWAYELGLRHFGESRVQEAAQKRKALADLGDMVWHLIGHLQTNKIAPALEIFDWIDSVDSLRLAKLLDQKAAQRGRVVPVCLQVKLAPDPDKYGWEVEDLLAALPALQSLDHLAVQGLMTILPLGLDPAGIQATFARLPPLAEQIRQQTGWPLPVLSMGMSGDYLQAVECGSTLIRLGRSLFGERSPSP